jgi:hypothetical protein
LAPNPYIIYIEPLAEVAVEEGEEGGERGEEEGGGWEGQFVRDGQFVQDDGWAKSGENGQEDSDVRENGQRRSEHRPSRVWGREKEVCAALYPLTALTFRVDTRVINTHAIDVIVCSSSINGEARQA